MEQALLISDAAKAVQVESHVLRYWEEELALPIRRNEQGHRYYALTEPTRDVQVADFMNSHIYDENGFVLNAPVWDLPTGTYALSFVEVYEDGSVRLAEKLGTVEVKEPAGE